MRIVKVGVLAPTNKGIPLGVQGESRATEVEFDTRPWFREYPSGTVSAVAKRDGDAAPYPLSLDVADGTAVWTVSDTDTAKSGEGAVELTMTSADVRVRSLTFKTLVTASLTDAPSTTETRYQLGKVTVPSLPETISNVWTDAELTANMSMTYKKDVNIVIADLTAQIAALKGTNDIAHDDGTASPDDAIDVPDNDVIAV